MDQSLPTSASEPPAELVAGTSREFAEDQAESPERFTRLLGDSTCRKFGIDRLPEDLVVSVVIPVYNERENLPDFRKAGSA